MNEFELNKLLMFMIMCCMLTGCTDERVSQIAREAADRQAEQNKAMAELQGQVAEGTRQLVEADAQSRQEMIGVHRELQSERSRLDQSWDKLHQQQRNESLLVAFLPTIGIVIVVCLLLGFCWYALCAAHSEEIASSDLSELLVEELTSEKPRLLQRGTDLPALTDGTEDGKSVRD